jgi:uncharacterized protein (DUF608 family)
MHRPSQLVCVASAIFSFLPVLRAESTQAPVSSLVPEDKKLNASWVKSLTARGEPEVYRGKELKFIGLPIGGLFAGQLYLGGDGQLWQWDIFNQGIFSGYHGEHYNNPLVPSRVLEQGFMLSIGTRNVPLNQEGFHNVSFRGEYPVGTVQYQDDTLPLTVKLEAFSPFIPLNTDDSSLPATILHFTLSNISAAPVEATLTGLLENAVARKNRTLPGERIGQTIRDPNLTFLSFSVHPPREQSANCKPDIIFEDWKSGTYEGWKTEGTAFGSGPVKRSSMVGALGNVGGDTEYIVNSHVSAPGSAVPEKDRAEGTLTSRDFIIKRKYLLLWLGGGQHPGKTGVNVLVNGKVIASSTAQNKNALLPTLIDLSAHEGERAVIDIIDHQSGKWGNVGVGKIVFTDRMPNGALEQLDDYGTMGLALLGGGAVTAPENKTVDLQKKLTGELGRHVRLAPGESTTVTFAITWCFPNLQNLPKLTVQGRSYASRFDSALAVARYLAANQTRLVDDTLLWRNTWYDSTLPYWFLDRTFLNASILATSTCFRFRDGRFWAWEGVGSCSGTCGHVYCYGQASGRLFPEIEREQREHVDFGPSQQTNGAIFFRGENNSIPAIDAQCGYILRALREHQLSTTNDFLKRIWPKVKIATDWLIAKDGTESGIIHGNQHNTLDTDWYGEVAWLSGLYQAGLLAAAEMAGLMKDPDYAAKCRRIAKAGREYMAKNLFNGEYHQNKVDPARPASVNSGSGCHIDQVMGQSWAFQVGLPRVFPKDETVKSLQSLWKYNFAPDVGPFREVNQQGRWYARPGEAGLIMCTFPRPDWNYDKAAGKAEGFQKTAAGYFNECMNGFEHQVAGHMIWEGEPDSDLVIKGLAIERAIHDRYGAAKRNPYNEIECGDHYGRSMASYGVFLAACGFQYDGPNGMIGFAPRITPEHFKAAFTAAEGWGSYSQSINDQAMIAELALNFGTLSLQAIHLDPGAKQPSSVKVTLDGKAVPASLSRVEEHAVIKLNDRTLVSKGQTMKFHLRP